MQTPFPLILFGNEAADTGGYQVGIRVAHALGRPCVTGIKRLELAGDVLRAGREYRGAQELFEVALPAVVSVKEGINLPRYPSLPGRLRAKRAEITVLRPEWQAGRAAQGGAAGPRAARRAGRRCSGTGRTLCPSWCAFSARSACCRDACGCARAPVATGVSAGGGVSGRAADAGRGPGAAAGAGTGSGSGPVLCLLERDADGVADESLRVLALARSLASAAGGGVTAVLFGSPGGGTGRRRHGGWRRGGW